MKVKTSGAKAHAKFSASSSDRWLSCPGSIRLSASAPPQEDSVYAAEGTEAHSCLELILRNGPHKLLSSVSLARSKYPAQTIVYCESAAREIFDRQSLAKGSELLIEARCDLPVSEPGQFGTTDAAIISHFGLLEVIDFKFGAGIIVDPEDNSQMLYYALGLAARYDYNFASVRLTIIQPRAAVGGETVRSWDTSIENLLAWREKFEAGILAAKSPDAPLLSGDHCRFCPAKPICPEISTRAFKQAAIDFDDSSGAISVPEAAAKDLTITPSQLSEMLSAFAKLEVWIESVREYAFGRAKRGDAIPGFKLVPKRAMRKWVNAAAVADEAFALLGADAFSEPELLSPNQLETRKHGDFIDTEFIKAWTAKRTQLESSGLTLVAASDKRAAVDPFSDFKDTTPKGDAPTKTPASKTTRKPKK